MGGTMSREELTEKLVDEFEETLDEEINARMAEWLDEQQQETAPSAAPPSTAYRRILPTAPSATSRVCGGDGMTPTELTREVSSK
jgi:hypothetical protein